MVKQSAGILVYRHRNGSIEVLLAHPGGPFWAKKDQNAWGLIKGEYIDGEEPFLAAKREFKEEVGKDVPPGKYINLGTVKIPSKVIYGWAVDAEFDTANLKSNLITIDCPPRSGRQIQIPEVDKVKWFEITKAIPKMHKGQEKFLERLAEQLNYKLEPPEQPSLF